MEIKKRLNFPGMNDEFLLLLMGLKAGLFVLALETGLVLVQAFCPEYV